MALATSLTPVVICADDYALTPGVCAGIIELAELGHISATSAMTLSPHWPTWARHVSGLQTRIDVGLHLDWTSAFAQQQGFGASLGQVMLHSLLRTLSPVTVRTQIEHQLDLFEQHAGTAPDHVDGHQHVQQFPVIRDALVDALIRRYPAAHRPWLRVSRVLGDVWDIKAKIINTMGAQALTQVTGVATVDTSVTVLGTRIALPVMLAMPETPAAASSQAPAARSASRIATTRRASTARRATGTAPTT